MYKKPKMPQSKQDRLDEAEGKKKGMKKKTQTVKGRLNEAEGKSRAKKLTEAQNKRLMEHSKQHGGMNSKHMRKMKMVMTVEGRTFAAAHKIAMQHDKKK